MAQKMYGEKSIGNLRDAGYSPAAIEDITFIAQKYRAKPSVIEAMFSEGYTPQQTEEIYAAARSSGIGHIKGVRKFYDHFRKHPGSLEEKMHKIHEAISESKGEWEYHLSETLPIAQGLSILYKWSIPEIAEHIRKGGEKDEDGDEEREDAIKEDTTEDEPWELVRDLLAADALDQIFD
jgi:hypothetical protein